MPTYDYQCTNCGYTFEEFQKMTDDLLQNCSVCGGSLKRLIGPGLGPIFKGTGFYQTDYKNSSTKSEPVKEDTKSKPKAEGPKVSKKTKKPD